MEFSITQKSKKKARKNRIRQEKKWIILRILTLLLFIVSAISFGVGILGISNSDYEKLEFFGIIFSISFIGAIILKAFMENLASHWIQDRLNEKLWMDDNTLYHFQQVAFAAGLNARSADSTGYTFALLLNSIRNVRFDEKSKRIEFLADGEGYHYSDVHKQVIDQEWALNGYEAVFYDYFEPSLIEILKQQGIKVETSELNDYSVFDNRI